jgi:putative ABC transport system ATP-binding protein
MTIEKTWRLPITAEAERTAHRRSPQRCRDFQNKLRQLDMGLENRLKTKVGLLSGGQRQALSLMMATIGKPRLLLLR